MKKETTKVVATGDLAEKYRPKRLSEVIGHEVAVTKLRGMLKSGEIPGALLFTGPTSVGKTTLARVLAAEINRKHISGQGADYKELNAGNTRSIEEMRELIKLSKFKPTLRKRIIVIDEAQQLLSNAVAAQALLKPLEDAGSTDTIWILCSMSPEKFSSGLGKAIANRCEQFILKESSSKDLMQQATLIRDGEGMKFLTTENLEALTKVCNNEMRTLAHLMKSVKDYYVGRGKSSALTVPEISEVTLSADSDDNALVASVIVSVLSGKYGACHRALLDVEDPYQFINKLLWAAQFQLNVAVLDGQRHRKVWWNPLNKSISAELKSLKPTLGQLGALNETLVELKQMSSSFAVGEIELISARLYRFIKDNLGGK